MQPRKYLIYNPDNDETLDIKFIISEVEELYSVATKKMATALAANKFTPYNPDDPNWQFYDENEAEARVLADRIVELKKQLLVEEQKLNAEAIVAASDVGVAEVCAGIPKAAKHAVTEDMLPCVYTEPEPVATPEKRDIWHELDSAKESLDALAVSIGNLTELFNQFKQETDSRLKELEAKDEITNP